MSRNTSIQKRANMGGHSFDAGNGEPGTIKRNEIGDFQRAVAATLKRLEGRKQKARAVTRAKHD